MVRVRSWQKLKSCEFVGMTTTHDSGHEITSQLGGIEEASVRLTKVEGGVRDGKTRQFRASRWVAARLMKLPSGARLLQVNSAASRKT